MFLGNTGAFQLRDCGHHARWLKPFWLGLIRTLVQADACCSATRPTALYLRGTSGAAWKISESCRWDLLHLPEGLDAPGACGHRLTCGHLMHEECVTEPLGLHGRFQDFPAISQLPRKALHYRNDRPLTSARPSNMPPTPSMRCWLRSALASGFRRRCKSASL